METNKPSEELNFCPYDNPLNYLLQEEEETPQMGRSNASERQKAARVDEALNNLALFGYAAGEMSSAKISLSPLAFIDQTNHQSHFDDVDKRLQKKKVTPLAPPTASRFKPEPKAHAATSLTIVERMAEVGEKVESFFRPDGPTREQMINRMEAVQFAADVGHVIGKITQAGTHVFCQSHPRLAEGCAIQKKAFKEALEQEEVKEFIQREVQGYQRITIQGSNKNKELYGIEESKTKEYYTNLPEAVLTTIKVVLPLSRSLIPKAKPPLKTYSKQAFDRLPRPPRTVRRFPPQIGHQEVIPFKRTPQTGIKPVRPPSNVIIEGSFETVTPQTKVMIPSRVMPPEYLTLTALAAPSTIPQNFTPSVDPSLKVTRRRNLLPSDIGLPNDMSAKALTLKGTITPKRDVLHVRLEDLEASVPIHFMSTGIEKLREIAKASGFQSIRLEGEFINKFPRVLKKYFGAPELSLRSGGPHDVLRYTFEIPVEDLPKSLRPKFDSTLPKPTKQSVVFAYSQPYKESQLKAQRKVISKIFKDSVLTPLKEGNCSNTFSFSTQEGEELVFLQPKSQAEHLQLRAISRSIPKIPFETSHLVVPRTVSYGTESVLIMPKMDGTLNDYHLSGIWNELNKNQKRQLLIDFATGLEELHLRCGEHGIAHRDIYPENLFIKIDSEGNPRGYIGDFGKAVPLTQSRAFQECGKSCEGHDLYMAPEVLKGVSLTASDMWSLGIVLSDLNGDAAYIQNAILEAISTGNGSHLCGMLKVDLLSIQAELRSIDKLYPGDIMRRIWKLGVAAPNDFMVAHLTHSSPPWLKKIHQGLLEMNPMRRLTATDLIKALKGQADAVASASPPKSIPSTESIPEVTRRRKLLPSDIGISNDFPADALTLSGTITPRKDFLHVRLEDLNAKLPIAFLSTGISKLREIAKARGVQSIRLQGEFTKEKFLRVLKKHFGPPQLEIKESQRYGFEFSLHHIFNIPVEKPPRVIRLKMPVINRDSSFKFMTLELDGKIPIQKTVEKIVSSDNWFNRYFSESEMLEQIGLTSKIWGSESVLDPISMWGDSYVYAVRSPKLPTVQDVIFPKIPAIKEHLIKMAEILGPEGEEFHLIVPTVKHYMNQSILTVPHFDKSFADFVVAHRKNGFLKRTQKQLVLDIATGLSFLHEKCGPYGFVHGNLVPENIIYEMKGESNQGMLLAYITNFEQARKLNSSRSIEVDLRKPPTSHFAFRAPEFFLLQLYQPASDVWALGMNLSFLFGDGNRVLREISQAVLERSVSDLADWYGLNTDLVKWLFDQTYLTKADMIEELWNAAVASPSDLMSAQLTRNTPPWLKALHQRMLDKNPHTRITATEIINALKE